MLQCFVYVYSANICVAANPGNQGHILRNYQLVFLYHLQYVLLQLILGEWAVPKYNVKF